MSKSKKSERHFSSRKEHTRIKHAIFSGTLIKSLSIANMLAATPPFNDGTPQTFTYIDLFAGPGKFKDEEKGSPLLAFEIFKNHLSPFNSVKNHFSKIKLLAFEETKTDADSLRHSLNEELEASNCKDHLEIKVEDGNWEKQSKVIADLLRQSRWGFVFADPFSTELDVNKFAATIEIGKNLKDILMLSNFRTLLRQVERQHAGDIERVCRSLGIPPEELRPEKLRSQEFPEFFKKTLLTKLRNLKQFTIGVAIPIAVGEILHSTDYFYLLCATNSVKVADNFLEAYEKEVKGTIEITMASNQMPLPFDCPISRRLDAEIYYSTKDKFRGKTHLYELIVNMFNDFLSWKEAISNPHYSVPTIKNITDSLNSLRYKKKMILSGDQKFFYRKKYQEHKEGDLKYSEINNKRDTQSVSLKVIES